jgi:D-alanyl-D-alanine carboxypeptidase/D-alanyl-D-alanine-endopeptidase (penicillin-binding protein 4)
MAAGAGPWAGAARAAAVIAGVPVLAGGLALGAAPVAASWQAADEATPLTEPPEAAGPLLPILDPAEAPPVDRAVLADALEPLLADPALGEDPGVVVMDADSGDLLFGARDAVALTPASSLKIVTGLAVLDSLGPQTQLTTEAVRNPDGTLVLVGGGDPSLLTLPPEGSAPYPLPATLAELADRTAAALLAEGVAEVAMNYDAGLFTGEALNPDWDPSFVGLGIITPVSALTLDAAAADIESAALDADPAATAADWFAARLTAAGVRVASTAAGPADPAAALVAAVASPPIAALVDHMLDVSDNDFAEALFRLAAIGRGLPGTFEGGVQAVSSTLATLGAPTQGLVVRDGSGLSRSNRIAPATLAAALRVAADPQPDAVDSETRDAADEAVRQGAGDVWGAVTWAPPGLAVGGLTGSLADRYDTDETAAGAGRVRAKTGTLTGVTSLTGVVATEQGRPLVFAVIGNDTADTLAAREALDQVAATLARCGCAAPAA